MGTKHYGIVDDITEGEPGSATGSLSVSGIHADSVHSVASMVVIGSPANSGVDLAQLVLTAEQAIKLGALITSAAQEALVAAIRQVVTEAPLFVPRMPKTGKPMSVRMTNCGSLGWVTDKENGYRYQATHPETGRAWPAIPDALLALWNEVSGFEKPPEACLVNFYDPDAKMGLHQDRDETEFAAPVVSVSLGDQCLFRVGGVSRSDPTRSFRLSSGDVFVFGGESRLVFHGVDRVALRGETPRRDVPAEQQLARLHGEAHFRAGGDQRDVARKALGQNVGALGGMVAEVGAGAQRRQRLTRERQHRRRIRVGERELPALGDFDGIGRAEDVEVGDGTQRGQMLDGLMRRSVFAQADGIVRHQIDHAFA